MKNNGAWEHRFRGCIVVFILLLCLNMCATAGMAVYVNHQITAREPDNFVLYIGLNDQNTNQQEISTKEAKKKINAIFDRYTGSYSYMKMKGRWQQDQICFEENTLAYKIVGIQEKKVQCIMDEVLQELNQICIMVEEQEKDCYFYYGSGVWKEG